MPSVTINGNTFTEFATSAYIGGVALPIVGTYYLKRPVETPYMYKTKFITFTGVLNDIGTKRTEPEGRKIICPALLVIDNSIANVTSTANTIMESFNQLQRYTITLLSGARNNCKLLTAAESDAIQLGNDRFGLVMNAVFIQMKKD